MDRRILLIVLILGLVLIGSGCATMIRGTQESLQVTSEPSGVRVEASTGQSGTTPCSFMMKRNQSALLKFTKEGYHPETVTVYPSLAGAGVILGGLIDYGTGAVYNLTPNPVHVMMKPLGTSQTTEVKEYLSSQERIKAAAEKKQSNVIETPKEVLPESKTKE